MTYEEYQKCIEEYNWDDGFALPKDILSRPQCDLALAIKIFYAGDGYGYLMNGKGSQKAWNCFIRDLYQDILNGRYKREHPCIIPLTKVQIYKLKKMNIPPIFYEGDEGK